MTKEVGSTGDNLARELFDSISQSGIDFDPEKIRLNLLSASLFLTAYELLKSSIIDIPKNFFVTVPKTENQEWLDRQLERYRDEIGVDYSSPDGFKLIPSCKWFQDLGAIGDSEIEDIRKIRDQRNKIAHELHSILTTNKPAIDVNLFVRISELLRQIEVFWFRHGEPLLDLNTGDVVDTEDVSDEEFISGKEMVLRLIASAALEYFLQFESKTSP